MSNTPGEIYDQVLTDLIQETAVLDIHTEEFREAARNLKTFSESRSLMPRSDTEPEVAPEKELTTWEKIRAGVAAVLDNETTRTAIKAGGAFAGVAYVAYATIRRDHVIERQAFAQANQRNS